MQPPTKDPADGPASDAGSSPPIGRAGTPDGAIPSPGSKQFWPWIFGFLLVAATFAAYLPALNGGFVWDDASWTTNLYQLFQSATGLEWIWFHPAALQQYYPLTATTFWLDYQFWKFWTLPYHVENVLLHAAAALLFWRLLVRLKLPGAWLAAALFALHPVMVESAAWITERKNVLSLPFYLAALLAYLRYAQGAASGGWLVASGEQPAAGNEDQGTSNEGHSPLATRTRHLLLAPCHPPLATRPSFTVSPSSSSSARCWPRRRRFRSRRSSC